MTVKQIQERLSALGYSPGPIDGLYGPLTQAAVKSFQADHALEQDGIPGPRTQKALTVGADGSIGPQSTSAPQTDAPAAGTAAPLGELSPQATEGGIPLPQSTTEETAAQSSWPGQYFTREEFRCQCGGKYCNGFPAEPAEKLVRLLDRARAYFGRPGLVISGLRCPTHNSNVGGVATSRHQKGWAADIVYSGISPATMERYFVQQPETAYCYQIRSSAGKLCGDVHVDVIV